MNAQSRLAEYFEQIKNGTMKLEDFQNLPDLKVTSPKEFGTGWSAKTGKLLVYGGRTQGRPMEFSRAEAEILFTKHTDDIRKAIADAGDKAFVATEPEASEASENGEAEKTADAKGEAEVAAK